MNFRDIYQLHKEGVFNLALQYTGNVEDAEEISQDVFVKVYEKLLYFREESSLKTWIYRITVNQSLDFLKARQRQKRSFIQHILRLDDGNAKEIPVFNHPGVELEQKEAVAHIFQCMNRLPENQKTALILLKIEGLSQKEVAEIMRISSKAVESLFQRAKINLEKILTQNEGK